MVICGSGTLDLTDLLFPVMMLAATIHHHGIKEVAGILPLTRGALAFRRSTSRNGPKLQESCWPMGTSEYSMEFNVIKNF